MNLRKRYTALVALTLFSIGKPALAGKVDLEDFHELINLADKVEKTAPFKSEADFKREDYRKFRDKVKSFSDSSERVDTEDFKDNKLQTSNKVMAQSLAEISAFYMKEAMKSRDKMHTHNCELAGKAMGLLTPFISKNVYDAAFENHNLVLYLYESHRFAILFTQEPVTCSDEFWQSTHLTAGTEGPNPPFLPKMELDTSEGSYSDWILFIPIRIVHIYPSFRTVTDFGTVIDDIKGPDQKLHWDKTPEAENFRDDDQRYAEDVVDLWHDRLN